MCISLFSASVLEFFRTILISSPYFNTRHLDRIASFWRDAMSQGFSSKKAKSEFELFVARQRAERSRVNAMDINFNSGTHTVVTLIQWGTVLGLIMVGLKLLDVQYSINHSISQQPSTQSSKTHSP